MKKARYFFTAAWFSGLTLIISFEHTLISLPLIFLSAWLVWSGCSEIAKSERNNNAVADGHYD